MQSYMQYYLLLFLMVLIFAIGSARAGAILSFQILPEESLEVGGKLRRICKASERGWDISWQVPFYKQKSPQILHDYLAYDNIQPDMNGVYTCFAKKEGHLIQKSFNLNVKKECGRRPGFQQRTNRISGGRAALENELPWQVYIANDTTDKWPDLFCSGAIIHEKWILTAAHCFLPPGPKTENFVVAIGTRRRKNKLFDGNWNNYPNVQIIPVEKVVLHYEFNRRLFENDIALLKLKRSIRFEDHIQPVCLPRQGENSFGMNCEVSGWKKVHLGPINDTAEWRAEWLQVATFQTLTNRNCKNIFARIMSNEAGRVYSTTICTHTPERDNCNGDGGSPLVCTRQNGQFVEVGIASWGNPPCARRHHPALFTNIFHHIQWINCMTGLNFP